MKELIDNLLSFSRMSRSKFNFSKTDLNLLVDEIKVLLKNDYKENNIEWKVKDLKNAVCDRNMFKQVFFNLISNSIKFSKNNDKIVIEIGRKKNNDEIIYYIKDNGVGFDMKYSDKIFNVFRRLHSEKDFEGTGIGLAIVKRIINNHGGRIWVESRINKGSVFYFSLPVLKNYTKLF
jgi:light-regulated signal transduction histidine kinase (bacteriophytochrome)